MFDEFVEHSSNPMSPTSPPVRSALSPNPFAISDAGSSYPDGGPVEEGMYEGFEEMEDQGDQRGVQADEGVRSGLKNMESGYLPMDAKTNQPNPIFSLSHVQFSLPSALLSVVVNANILCMAVHPLSLILLDLAQPANLINVDLPKPSSSSSSQDAVTIKALFGDPTGKHLLITTQGSDAFYLSTAALTNPGPPRKPRPLKLRHPITCVAWSPSLASSQQNDCILGGPNGQISTLSLPPSDDIFKTIATKSFERDHNVVFTLPETDSKGITGLSLGFWESSKSKHVWVVATTKERLYEMHGTASGNSMTGRGGWAEELFKPYRDNPPRFQEMIASPESPTFTSRLASYCRKSNSTNSLKPTVAAWSTANGLYTAQVPKGLTASATVPDVFTVPRLLPYPRVTQQEELLNLLVTEFHYVYLFRTRVVGVSRLTDKVIWDQRIPLKVEERPIGLAADPVHHTFWCFTDRALHEIVVTEEDRHVWKAKLDAGEFDDARKYAKNPSQVDLVRCRHADNLFDTGKYVQAAQIYAKCSRSFEYVSLRFIDADERDALRMYLADRLARMDKRDLTQRMMLATWLVEIYLSKCNTLEDIIAAEQATSDVDSLRVELQLMGEDLRNFITTYQQNLDKHVMYDLIQAHGRTDIYLFYAGLVQDHQAVIEHWIEAEKWQNALDELGRQVDAELYYRFATLLFTHLPDASVDSWLRVPSLSTRRLIPALLLPAKTSRPAIRYLTTTVSRGTADESTYNALIALLANDQSLEERELLDFLSNTPDDPLTEKPSYDLDYALRTCKAANRISSTIFIYSRMGLFENSVDLALQRGDLELAQISADKVEDNDVLRRKLWLKIAKWVVQDRKDIKSAMAFLESTDLLRIEDILPFFPDFEVIDDFKDEICRALESYRSNIETLKTEMDDATQSAENIKKEIEALQNRFMTVDITERCSHCQALLMTRQFYVFPCQHVFHVDCLIKLAKEYLSASVLRRVIHLQNELISLTRQKPSARAEPEADINALMGPGGRNKFLAAGDKLRELIVPDILASAVSGGGFGKKKGRANGVITSNPKDQARIEKLREEVDSLLASNCVLCEGSVVTLDKPFVTAKDNDGSWDI